MHFIRFKCDIKYTTQVRASLVIFSLPTECRLSWGGFSRAPAYLAYRTVREKIKEHLAGCLLGRKLLESSLKLLLQANFTHDLGVSYLYLVFHCSYDTLAK